MTTLTFHLARSLGRGYGPGDEIVVTELDHHANVDPWRALERERGVTVRVARMTPETGETDFDDLASPINERTRLVAIGAASNALGTISDVPRDRMAHAVVPGLRRCRPLRPTPPCRCAGHRLRLPRVLGIQVLRSTHRRPLRQEGTFPSARRAEAEAVPDAAPERLETGTQNHEGIVGAAAAVEFLASLAEGPTRRARLHAAFDELHRRSQALIVRLWSGLADIRGVTVYGPAPSRARTPTVSFALGRHALGGGRPPPGRFGLFVSHGDFYATTAVERLGRSRDGLVRVGCACYTTEDEIERLLEGVHGLTGR